MAGARSSSEDTLVTKTSETVNQELEQSIATSGRSSEDTLVQSKSIPKKPKTKKTAQNNAQRLLKVDGKLSGHVARMFADELARGAKYIDPTDVLKNVIASHKSASIQQPPAQITKLNTSITTVEQVCITIASTGQQAISPTTDSANIANCTTHRRICSSDDQASSTALKNLVDRFGKVSHMGVLDKSYTFFVNKSRDAALCFKVVDNVAIISGDPLCEWQQIDNLLAEFAAYRKKYSWEIAFLGATTDFIEYARSRSWITMQFGLERVLNPMTNQVLLETGAGKRTISTSKQLLKKGVSLGIHVPERGSNPVLQDQLADVYAEWLSDRNNRPIVQAYISVLDPMTMPQLMIYIYASDANGKICGFAALRKIVNGYHLDPCIALPDAPRGISELLIIASMSLLQKAGISYLSLGFEPSPELGEITGVPKPAQSLMRSIHRRSYCNLPIGGKRAFYDKFRPDDTQSSPLFIVIPARGIPKLKHMKAMMHVCNINISKLISENVKQSWAKSVNDRAKKDKSEGPADKSSVEEARIEEE